MVTLTEAVASPFAGDPQLGVGPDEVGSWVDNLGSCDLRFEALQARRAPAAEEGAIPELGNSLKREEDRPSDEKSVVTLGER